MEIKQSGKQHSGRCAIQCPLEMEADSASETATDVYVTAAIAAIQARIEANRNSSLKRLLDYVLTLPLFLITLPLFCAVWLVIRIIDPQGSPFFVQPRAGLDGTSFPMLKFRTMYVGAADRLAKFLADNPHRRQEWETVFKLDNDPRVLPVVGNFLRRTSLDELPNLVNILRGDMSLVGPRPFPQYHLDKFSPEFSLKRRSVWPGLTGLWQIYRGGLAAQQHWDEQYIDHWSIMVDIKILLKTIPTVLLARKPHF